MLTFIGSKHSSMAKVKQIPLCLLSPKWYLGKIFKKIRIYSTIADLVKPMFEWNRPGLAFSSEIAIYLLHPAVALFYAMETSVRNYSNNKNFLFSHPVNDTNSCISCYIQNQGQTNIILN